MTTIILLFLCGYIFHLLYKLIDKFVVLIVEKRRTDKGVTGE